MKLSAKHIAFLDFGSFPGTIMFTCGFTYDEILKFGKQKHYDEWMVAMPFIKELFDEEETRFFAARRTADNVECFFICLKDRFNFSDESHRLLAHEIIHIVSFNLKRLLDPMEENEAFCYTHTHIMEQCHKILRS